MVANIVVVRLQAITTHSIPEIILVMFVMGTPNRKHSLRARIIIDDGG
jgi:hypothetical protein